MTLDEPDALGYNMNAQLSDGTKISCSMSVDGVVEARNSSEGPYSVVSCEDF